MFWDELNPNEKSNWVTTLFVVLLPFAIYGLVTLCESWEESVRNEALARQQAYQKISSEVPQGVLVRVFLGPDSGIMYSVPRHGVMVFENDREKLFLGYSVHFPNITRVDLDKTFWGSIPLVVEEISPGVAAAVPPRWSKGYLGV